MVWPLQTVNVEAFRDRNVFFGGDSNDRHLVSHICTWAHAQGMDVEMVYVSKLRISADSNEDVFIPPAVQPHVCHIKILNASIANSFHYGIATVAPASQIHLDFLGNRLRTHAPYRMTANGTQKEYLIPSSDEVAKDFWPALIRDYLPRRPLYAVVQSSLWDSLAPVLEVLDLKNGSPESLEVPTFASDFINHINWTNKASTFVKAVQGSLQAKKIFWRTNPGCPFGTPVGKVSALQRQIVAEKVRSGESAWTTVKLLDWAAKFDVKSAADCEGNGITAVHYKVEGYWVYLEQVLSALSDK